MKRFHTYTQLRLCSGVVYYHYEHHENRNATNHPSLAALTRILLHVVFE
jgi:hypothetical protein